MSTELAVLLAVLGAAAACFVLTGVAVRVALATDFVDHPKGYKGHSAATPYLGGAAVLGSVLAVTLLLSGPGRALGAVLACAAALAVVGTIDDRVPVAPRWRVASELVAGVVLFSVGVRWAPTGVVALDLLFSAVWVVGVVNAFNLMDNIDGATATITGVSAAALGVIALSNDQPALAVAAFALLGACLGFLPHNLAGPARIFLGDGGSMPLGFIVAALSMATLGAGSLGPTAALAGVLVAGLPVLDTTLVVISRRRRGVPFTTGGRDHLTHRLLARAGSARRVALLLAVGQAVLVGLAIAASQLGAAFGVAALLVAVVAGLGAIVALESPGLRPSCDFERARDRELAARRFAALAEASATLGRPPASATAAGAARPRPRNPSERA